MAAIRHLELARTTRGGIAQYECGCSWAFDDFPIFVECPCHTMCRVIPIARQPGDVPAAITVSGSGLAHGSLVSAMSGAAMPIQSGFTVEKKQPERPELELMFDTEPIIGWRAWRVVQHELHGGTVEPRLQPLTGRQLWHPRRRFDADCLPRELIYAHGQDRTHEAPNIGCHCGVWAVRHEQLLPTSDVRLAGDWGLLAIGQVALWGRVIEFEKGWRARYAYPTRLQISSADIRLAEELERLYGVTVDVDLFADQLGRMQRLEELQRQLESITLERGAFLSGTAEPPDTVAERITKILGTGLNSP